MVLVHCNLSNIGKTRSGRLTNKDGSKSLLIASTGFGIWGCVGGVRSVVRNVSDTFV